MNKYISAALVATIFLFSTASIGGSAPPPNQVQPSSSTVTSESYAEAFNSGGFFKVLKTKKGVPVVLSIPVTRNGIQEIISVYPTLNGDLIKLVFPDESSIEFPANI